MVALRSSSLLSQVLGTALVALVIALFILKGDPAPVQCTGETDCVATSVSTGVIIEECATGNDCVVGYYLPDYGVCQQVSAPNGTNCSDVCYTEDAVTTCNTVGLCTGHRYGCRGDCETDGHCNTSIPIDPFWLPESDNWGELLILWGYRYICFAERCELHLIDLYWQDDPSNYGEPVGGYQRCQDYLEPEWTDERIGCLTQESFLLDTNLTNGYFADDTPEHASQFRMCTFYYNCVPFDVQLLLKRGITDDGERVRKLSVAKDILAELGAKQARRY